MDITSWIFLVCFTYIWLYLHLMYEFFLIFKNHWQTWIYLWQNNTYHKVWEFIYIFPNLDYGWNFLMLYDIDLHQLNLGPFKTLKLVDEIWFQKCVFLHLFTNTCIIISSLKKNATITLKRRRFYRWALNFF